MPSGAQWDPATLDRAEESECVSWIETTLFCQKGCISAKDDGTIVMLVTPLSSARCSLSDHAHQGRPYSHGRSTHLVPDVVVRLLNHIRVVVIEVAARQKAVDCLLVRVAARPHGLAVCHLEAGLSGGVQAAVLASSVLLKHSWELAVCKARVVSMGTHN